jgi:Ala-tRNA(Pro) deacylase
MWFAGPIVPRDDQMSLSLSCKSLRKHVAAAGRFVGTRTTCPCLLQSPVISREAAVLVSPLRHRIPNGGAFMFGTSTIHEFLRKAHVPYTVVPHLPAFTAQGEAAATHIPGRDWAKVVVCFIDGEPVEAVVPAPSFVNFDRLLELAGGSGIRLAEEDELRRLFPGCETGAMPPFGPLYGQTVYVDAALAAEHVVVFNAGSHRDAIAMRWTDFVKMVNPIVGKFAEPPLDPLAEYRQSYRE